MIGITERGDASIDMSWVEKLNTVNGAIVITKNVTDKFIERVLENKDKLVLHATCTGYGGTVLEPNVPEYTHQLDQVYKLVSEGFAKDRVVIRVDPIIPTKKGLEVAKRVMDYASDLCFHRFRISVIDTYPHVRERFKNTGLPLPYGNGFQASDEQFRNVDNMLSQFMAEHPDAKIESCAEPSLSVPIKQGCVSGYELDMFGVKETNDQSGKQRKSCLCCSQKTELLNSCHQCPNGCLYCYWRD